jgi:hypothetical protein
VRVYVGRRAGIMSLIAEAHIHTQGMHALESAGRKGGQAHSRQQQMADSRTRVLYGIGGSGSAPCPAGVTCVCDSKNMRHTTYIFMFDSNIT